MSRERSQVQGHLVLSTAITRFLIGSVAAKNNQVNGLITKVYQANHSENHDYSL